MKKIILVISLFSVPSLTLCLSYRQCVVEFQEMRTALEGKKEECEQTKATMDEEYNEKLNEMTERHREEFKKLVEEYDANTLAIEGRHAQELQQLKETYEQ